MAIEDYDGMPQGVTKDNMPVSRSTEFSGGISGGGSTHSVAQSYKSVLSPIGNDNGQSPTTYTQHRVQEYNS